MRTWLKSLYLWRDCLIIVTMLSLLCCADGESATASKFSSITHSIGFVELRVIFHTEIVSCVPRVNKWIKKSSSYQISHIARYQINYRQPTLPYTYKSHPIESFYVWGRILYLRNFDCWCELMDGLMTYPMFTQSLFVCRIGGPRFFVYPHND